MTAPTASSTGTTASRLDSPVARATRLCLRSQLLVWTVLWLTLPVIAAAIAVLTNHFGTVELSAWSLLGAGVRWFTFAMLVFVTSGAVGPYVANGLTRRAFARVVVADAVVTAVAFTAVWTLGQAVETAVFRAQGWPTAVTEHLYADVSQLGLVALEQLLGLLAYAASGALVGATYYRTGAWWGTVSLVVTLLPLAVAELLLSGGLSLGSVELTAGAVVPLRALGALVAAVLGFAALHPVLRRAPLRRPTV